MTKVLLEQETNPATTTRWLQKMSGPASIKGHALHKERDGYWCHCGHYCGGLEALNEWVYRNGGLDIPVWAHRRHGLHLIQICHQTTS